MAYHEAQMKLTGEPEPFAWIGVPSQLGALIEEITDRIPEDGTLEIHIRPYEYDLSQFEDKADSKGWFVAPSSFSQQR